MAAPALPLALAAAGAAFLFLGGKKDGGRSVTPLPPEEGGLMLGQLQDGTVVIRYEARAFVIGQLITKGVGVPQSNGAVLTIPLLDQVNSPLASAQAWANQQVAGGKSVAISYEGAPRLASFPPSQASQVCRDGTGLALLLEALQTPAGGGGGGGPLPPGPAAPSPSPGGYSPPAYTPPASPSPGGGGGYYPPGDIPVSPPAAPAPAVPNLPPIPGLGNIPQGWLPPGFGGTPTPPGGGAPVAPGVPTPPAAPATYMIQAGDTGMKLAQRGTGNSLRWREIGKANPQLRPVNMEHQTVTDGSATHAGYLPWYGGQTVINVPPGWVL